MQWMGAGVIIKCSREISSPKVPQVPWNSKGRWGKLLNSQGALNKNLLILGKQTTQRPQEVPETDKVHKAVLFSSL